MRSSRRRRRARAARGRRRGGARRARGEGRRVRGRDRSTSSVCHMALFKDPDGNSLMLHHRYKPYARQWPGLSCSSATSALPLPTTRDEAWRFTDLKGFDPDSFGHAPGSDPGHVRRADARHRGVRARARSPRPAIEIERAPEGITFEPLARPPAPARARRLGREVRRAQRRALGARTARRRAARHGARRAALRAHRELGRRRLALLAPARRRGGRLALHADRGVRVGASRRRRLLERRRRAVRRGRARSSSTSRCRTSRSRRGTSRRITRASSATPSSTGSPAASARRRGRSASRTTSPARARSRA